MTTFDHYPRPCEPGSVDIHQGSSRSVLVAISTAVFRVMLRTRHLNLLYDLHPVDLASHSQSLNRYEISSIDRIVLARFIGLDSPGVEH